MVSRGRAGLPREARGRTRLGPAFRRHLRTSEVIDDRTGPAGIGDQKGIDHERKAPTLRANLAHPRRRYRRGAGHARRDVGRAGDSRGRSGGAGSPPNGRRSIPKRSPRSRPWAPTCAPLKVFQVSAAVIDEDVLEDGQKFQYAGVAEAIVQTPNRLRMTTTSERSDRLFLYDGKNVTLYGKRVNYYATAPAPPTIRELVTKLEEEFGISLPLVDLFRWGAPDWKPDGITSALDGGLERSPGDDLRALPLPSGRPRLADLDPEGRLPAAAQAGDHHPHRRGAASAQRWCWPGTWRRRSTTRRSRSIRPRAPARSSSRRSSTSPEASRHPGIDEEPTGASP